MPMGGDWKLDCAFLECHKSCADLNSPGRRPACPR
jgi:hypothetical protein